MFDTLTASAITTAAGSWVTEIMPIVLVVLGVVVALGLSSWVIGKIRSVLRARA